MYIVRIKKGSIGLFQELPVIKQSLIKTHDF